MKVTRGGPVVLDKESCGFKYKQQNLFYSSLDIWGGSQQIIFLQFNWIKLTKITD